MPAERAVSAVPEVLQSLVSDSYGKLKRLGDILPSPHWCMIGSDSQLMG